MQTHPKRHVPVRPNLEFLKHEAKDLLRGIRAGDPDALADLAAYFPKSLDPASATLANAQHVLARGYGVASWTRLVQACEMVRAIWDDDLEAVRRLVLKHPSLLAEDARGVPGNWGPPMSYAANLGRDRIIEMLRGLGASDLQHAFERACLQGKLDTARMLHGRGAQLQPGAVMGPCETLSGEGLAFLLELGAEFADENGNRLAPVALILQTYSRNPAGKHRCLELAAAHGADLPDTPAMAVHRGRIDLLERLLNQDPGLLSRTFGHQEIYPPSLGCDEDESLALHGTPLAGGTLLHLCVDMDEIEVARWLLEKGADVNATGAVDADGFGGHTALFGCVVSQPYVCGRQRDASMARLLLDAGANPNARASLAKRLRFVEDESRHEYRDVTPLAWGEQFHGRDWVNRAAMALIAEAGGHS